MRVDTAASATDIARPVSPDAVGFERRATGAMTARPSSPPGRKPVLLVKNPEFHSFDRYKSLFKAHLPKLAVRHWRDVSVQNGDVRYAFVWQPEPGRLAQFPNLQLILSSAAGVEHIVRDDPAWPRHVPIVRMADEEVADRMASYICHAVQNLQHHQRQLATNQARHAWQHPPSPRLNRELRVGIMGLGHLGEASARRLAANGYPVAGWSRNPKSIPDVTCHAGPESRDAFLGSVDVLVCLLPATPDTKAILCADSFARMPAGGAVVNAGRGSHLVMEDLVEALNSNHLSGAVLDAFETEPLPADDVAWSHPRITVTPHIAAISSDESRTDYVAGAILSHEAGRKPKFTYDPTQGY